MSLGGVRDEAEIRGHRRTYIGSLPGKLIQKYPRLELKTLFFCLMKLTKWEWIGRGDPASALLEVLDPEQNHSFNDHYLEVDMTSVGGNVHMHRKFLEDPGPFWTEWKLSEYLDTPRKRKLR